TFHGWQFETAQDRIAMTEWRKNEMLMQVHRWIATIVSQKRVKVRWLVSFIGKLNFLRLRIQRSGLHMRNLNKCRTNAAINIGWNSRIKIWKCCLKEIYSQKSQILHNPLFPSGSVINSFPRGRCLFFFFILQPSMRNPCNLPIQSIRLLISPDQAIKSTLSNKV
ncbi:MAG: hypothetical protein EZS28_053814, partial [Streblomastix strix]